MNITVFKRISIGEFATYLGALIKDLPSQFAQEKAALQSAKEEMERRLNADRRNHTLEKLKSEDMPLLRFLVGTLAKELRFCKNKSENEEDMQRLIASKFKKRKSIESMVNDAKILCEFDAPENEYCLTLFNRIKALVEDMDINILIMSEEDARICAIGRCTEVRDEAIRILQRIKERATAFRYEEERREAGEMVVCTLETLISMGERTEAARKGRKKKNMVEGDVCEGKLRNLPSGG